jgi:hypothetical protein
MSNSFIILMALSQSKESLSTTQISEKIVINSRGQSFKVSVIQSFWSAQRFIRE